MYQEMAKSHPSLERGKVWCRTCRREQSVDSAECLHTGWPKCCGYTMTIDHPSTWQRSNAMADLTTLDTKTLCARMMDATDALVKDPDNAKLGEDLHDLIAETGRRLAEDVVQPSEKRDSDV